ncbi:DUF3042 family protein [Lentilactobacillus kribbianus]|uniref:DUF3042 family protein n=1 Tax=Lentilactobacillus kribbianus TaxID=2729622 RepID=UPI001555C97C|nr:DUF3042 family protein [Lentilactobacillus kribbianus]
MSKFSSGLAVGILGTVAVFAGSLLSFKKTVVEPIEVQEQKFDDNRKKAMRKSRSAHHG